jgi:hypothetical protein
MDYIKRFSSFFIKEEFDYKDIDPFGEEDWEEEKRYDKKNYIQYDNIEQGHSNYPLDAPVMLKEGAEDVGLHIKPYDVGIVHGIRPVEPTYQIYWLNRGRVRNHYTYDLLYHKDYLPKDWTPGVKTGFEMGDRKVYELWVHYSKIEEKIKYNIHRLNIEYQRRKIIVRDSNEYQLRRNIPVSSFVDFLDKTYGYLQNIISPKYSKDIIHFTNKFDLNNAENVKDFTNLIKRRFSAYQGKYTRNIKKENSKLEKFVNSLEIVKSIKVDDIKLPKVGSSSTDKYNAYRFNFNFSKTNPYDLISSKVEYYENIGVYAPSGPRFKVFYNSYKKEKSFDEYKYQINEKAHALIVIFEGELSEFIERDFKVAIKKKIESYIEIFNKKIEEIKSNIESYNKHKNIIFDARKNFNLVDLIRSYLD